MALSEAALITRYFGTVAAASARTPPAERVKAALSGGLFRSAAAALTPGQIGISEALELLHQDHVVFVDTRDPAEVVKTGSVPGAVRIPRHLLVLRAGDLKDDNTRVVAFGSNESRSMQAGQVLRNLGFKDVSAMASYAAWQDAGAPVQMPPPPIGMPVAAMVA